MRAATGATRVLAGSTVVRPASATWAAHAASVWAFAFAAMSFYWAAGGTFGLGTVSGTIESAARGGGWFIAVVWLVAVVKVAGGMLALSLVRPWGERFPRPLLLAGTVGAGALMTLYAAANLGARGLQAVGVIPTPASMHSVAAWWHLLFWDPWFLAGGVLFLLAAWRFRAAQRGGSASRGGKR